MVTLCKSAFLISGDRRKDVSFNNILLLLVYLGYILMLITIK